MVSPCDQKPDYGLVGFHGMTTTPFTHYDNGVPTADPSQNEFVPVCGMPYDLGYPDACNAPPYDDWFGESIMSISTPPQGTPIPASTLRFSIDCSCLLATLGVYATCGNGIYSLGDDPLAYIDSYTPVFVGTWTCFNPEYGQELTSPLGYTEEIHDELVHVLDTRG
jgi:hypothetical protein